jgi:methyl-accepting chemotaxis protein
MTGKLTKFGYGSILAKIVIVISVILFIGCGQKEVRTIGSGLAPSEGQISKEELRRMLDKFEAFFTARLRQMSNDIYDRIPGKRTEKTTLLMRARMVQGLNAMLDQDDSVIAFIETWTMCERFRTYLEKGEGAELYGEGQEIAVAAARQIENEVERIGRIFLKDDVFETAKKNISEFANSNPMKGTFSNVEVFATSPRKGELNPFVSIAKIPMTPFRAMEGVDRTASAIYRFTETADRATDVLSDMPESTRWQLKLLLYDLEETDMIKTFLTSATQFSESSSRLSKSVEDLPKQLRQELSAFIEEADDKQQNLRKTLEQTEKTTVTIGNTLEKVNKTADTLGNVARDLTETSKAWESAAKATGDIAQKFSKEKDPSAKKQSFNVNEYRAAAEQISRAANNIESLLTSINNFSTSRKYNRIIDAVTWRAIGFVFTCFALAVVYRVISTRLPGRKRKND